MYRNFSKNVHKLEKITGFIVTAGIECKILFKVSVTLWKYFHFKPCLSQVFRQISKLKYWNNWFLSWMASNILKGRVAGSVPCSCATAETSVSGTQAVLDTWLQTRKSNNTLFLGFSPSPSLSLCQAGAFFSLWIVTLRSAAMHRPMHE